MSRRGKPKRSSSHSSGKRKSSDKKLNKIKLRYPQIKFDTLQMYMDYPHTITSDGCTGVISIKCPTLGDIIELGQDRFYMAINPFVTNTTAYRLPLWESGKDWCEMSDFELFVMFVCGHNLDSDALRLLFGDEIDWNKFVPIINEEEGLSSLCLYNEESDLRIDETVYQHMTQYLHHLLQIFPEEKITTDPVLKQWYISADKKKRKNTEEMAKEGKEREAHSLQPLISACVNHPGFKYKKSELKELSIYEFYDSVSRLQVYEASTAVMKGMYSGFVDGSKLDKDAFNFMRPLNM